jgi:hypothetical protein
MRAMDTRELKSLVEAGAYKPDPAEIATAMLSRRGVKELLAGIHATAPAPQGGRSPESPGAFPRAA